MPSFGFSATKICEKDRMYNTALQWLEDSLWAVVIRQSTWLYPALEIIHIVGIILLVGPALMFDLRLLGFAKRLPVPLLAGFLLSWSRGGLLLIVPSGIFLFITNAITLGYDRVFWLKMILLVVAGLNALVFNRFIFRLGHPPGEARALHPAAKLCAMVSILVWLAVVTCGRLLAY